MDPHQDVRGRGPGWAAPLAVAVIWGVNVPVMKAALLVVHPCAFNALRLSLSALALGIADQVERRGRPPPPAPWRAVIGLGLLTSLLYQVLFIEGIDRTSASHTGFLIASGPLWTALIARALGVERPGARAWLALSVAFVGTCLVASARDAAGGTRLGNALLLLAMIAWALGTVLSRPVLSTFPATRLAFLFTCVVLPGHWLLALPHLKPALLGLGPGGWAAVSYSGVLSTGIAYALWNASVRRIGPARTSAFTNVVPLVALALAWAFLGERPGGVQLAGGALVLLGIALLRRARAGAG